MSLPLTTMADPTTVTPDAVTCNSATCSDPTYLLSDHLGSTSITTDVEGNLVSETRYDPWGKVRYASGLTPTDYTYTDQYSYMDDPTTSASEGFGLMFYNARWYDSYLNHFTQPDSIVPLASQGTQAFDRYAAMNNNPVRYNDPTGHMAISDSDGNGCNTPGSPKCILDRYGYNSTAMDRELENYYRAYPEYNPSIDSHLQGIEIAIVSAAISRVGCNNGSISSCLGLLTLGAVTSPVPVGMGGFLTNFSNSSLPSNLAGDVSSGGGWASGFPSQQAVNFSGSANPTIYGSGTQLYRLHSGNATGSWWTTAPPKSELQFRIDYAHLPEWGSVNQISVLEIPFRSFTQGWTGPASYQGGFYVGGGTQVYLPHVNPEWIVTMPFP